MTPRHTKGSTKRVTQQVSLHVSYNQQIQPTQSATLGLHTVAH